MKVTICIITYKRPAALTRLLISLGALAFSERDPDITIVVVDNEGSGEVMQICTELGSQIHWPIRCVTENQRGLSFARNRAINEVGENADFVAFIDDDEMPDPCWLDALMRVQREYNADVVTGATFPQFTSAPPRWISKGHFFERTEYPTGYSRSVARSSNVLLRAQIFRKIGGFDPRFAFTGGEDSHFFMRVHRAGFRIIQANEAVVREWIPDSRMRAGWIVQRAFRCGTTYIRAETDLNPSFTVRISWMLRALARICKGLFEMLLAGIFVRHERVKSLQRIANGFGIIAGLWGIRYEEYR